MSADLWKEFGSPNQELLVNPWHQPSVVNLPTGTSDSEVASSSSFTHVSEFRTEDTTDVIQACEHLKNRLQGSETVNQPHSFDILSPAAGDIIDQASTITKPRRITRRQCEPNGCLPSTTGSLHLPERRVTPIQTESHELDQDDDWGDFVEGNAAESADPTSVKNNSPPMLKSSYDIQVPACPSSIFDEPPLSEKARTVSTTANSTSSNLGLLDESTARGPAPSNIPPPSILLRLISRIFQSLCADLKNDNLQPRPSSQPPYPVGQQSSTKLRRRLALIRASARIIAGRKLRWSRDSHLSQSMKIGPAHGGRAGGMKLAVLDRSETRREDREVEEVIRIWKQQIGSFRALLLAFRAQEPHHILATPELAEKMPIRVAKLSEGGIVAARPCFLCGLKRDERVDKVDIQVQDSFGEWWVNHWGHVDCVIFWEEQEEYLQQR
jgi:hypothetical protein